VALLQQPLRGITTQPAGGASDQNFHGISTIPVLLITDIELAGAERFVSSRYVQSGISAFLREPQRVVSAVRKLLSAPQHTHFIVD
jgi:fructose-specific phosphotransferase system component IIB